MKSKTPLVSVILPGKVILEEISKIASKIANDFSSESGGIFALVLMDGAYVYWTHLNKALKELGFYLPAEKVKVSSYKGTESTGKLTGLEGLNEFSTFNDCKVLIVDDIYDTGTTMEAVINHLINWCGFSYDRIYSTTLFHKPSSDLSKTTAPNYPGIKIPDKFVIGFGLDYDGKYRDLPFLGELHLN